MKETGIINADISYAISRLGHMDEMLVCDAGFPIPKGVEVIDISLAPNMPTVLDVLDELLKHFSVEKVVLANETKNTGPTRFKEITSRFGAEVDVETVMHTDLKLRSRQVKVVIRTGDFTAYSNILMVSGAGDRWYVEKG